MFSVLVIILLIFVFAIFFLSIFAPSGSNKRFWMTVRKMGNVLDQVCYWIFNLFGIIAIMYIL